MKYIMAMALATLISVPSFSQKLIGLHYSMAFPLGETHDFINNGSFRGFGLEGRWFLSKHVTGGISADWHTFYKNLGKVTETSGSTTTTGYKYRYVNDVPILLTAHYYTGADGNVRFYAGGGIGTAWAEQRTDLGLYTGKTSNWHFALAPEVGVLLPLGFSTSANVALQYSYLPKAGDSMDYSYLGLKVGLLFR